MSSPLQRLYQTKLALLATIATTVGIALLVLAHWSESRISVAWLKDLPITDVGSALFTTGLIAIFFQYIGDQDAEQRATARLREVLHDAAPDIRDAVVDGFAFAPESLTNVTSSTTLDRIIENCLTIRLGEQQLGRDAYADLRAQVVRAPERWRDVQASIALSPWNNGPAAGKGSMFVATVRWEYRVIPSNAKLRFTCVSDLQEYRSLLDDPASTAAWYFEPIAGLDAAATDAFRLLQCTVDGIPQTARRTVRRDSQTFTVDLGAELVAEHREITIAYTYRTLVQRNGHLIHFDLSRPTKGLQIDLSYGDCGIRHVNVLDYIAGVYQPHITELPASDLTPSIQVGFDGWVFPKGGVAFVWVLEEEMSGVEKRLAKTV